MKPSAFLLFLWMVGVSFLSCTSPTSQIPTRPNILFLMGDDHTTQAISAYGGFLAAYANTVHIDQLAEEGMLFRNVFCTNSICSPSRATILTGKYSHKNGIRMLNETFDGTQFTTATALQAAGYETAVFGKWHLKSHPIGFNDYKILPKQGRYQDPEMVVKGQDSLVTFPGWSTDVISQLTMDFLEQRDPDKPFFVMTHFKATHDPWDSRAPYDTLWENQDLPEPPNLYDLYDQRSKAALRTTLKLEQINQGTFPHERLDTEDWQAQRGFIYQQYIKAFLRCGRVLDENVGKLITFLKENGLYENTIIIYTADQGHFLGEHGFFSKRFMYEEAMRMPLIIRYPEWVEAGSSNEDLIINTDFAPTILEMAGVEIPPEVQGESFLPNLKGQTAPTWRNAVYYHYWQHLLHRNVTAHYGVRTWDRKLIFYYGLPLDVTDYDPTPAEWELFDLQKDPMEMRNVYQDVRYAAEIDSLKNILLFLRDKYEDLPDKYPEWQKVEEEHFW